MILVVINIYTVSCCYLLLTVAAEILEKELLQIWISNSLVIYAVGVDNKGNSWIWFDYGVPPMWKHRCVTLRCS